MATKEERVLLPTSVTPSHYALVLSPDLEALTFYCDEDVNVTVSSTTSEIKMHSKEISIIKASFEVAGNPVNEAEEISYHLKDTTVTFKFKDPLPIGDGVLKISYTGILNGDMAGFYKVRPVSS